MSSELDDLLRTLERLARRGSTAAAAGVVPNGAIDFYGCFRRITEEWLTSRKIHRKTRLQGLMSCIAVFSKIDQDFGNSELEVADEMISYLFQECARLLLHVECVSLKRHDPTLCLMRTIVESSLTQDISSKHRKYFELLKMLTEKPWNGPELLAMLNKNEPTKKHVSNFVNELENSELVLLRIEALIEGNCTSLAQRLIDRLVLVKGNDVQLMSLLLILLHKDNLNDEFHRQCKKISCCMACDILCHMDETDLKRTHHNAVLIIAQTFFLLDWVKTSDLTCTKVLLQYWLKFERHHFVKDEKEFCKSMNKILVLTNSSEKLTLFIDVMESQFGSRYTMPCLKVALKVLQSARHRFTCAQVYVKDRAEISGASKSLASVCRILARYFQNHPQMKMNCLLSAACISPSNDHYQALRSFFESSAYSVSLHPVPPSGVEWEMYTAVWDAVRYLQPVRFQSCTEWPDINSNLRSYYRKAGWRFDSLAMAFKHNHNRKGIGCGLQGVIKLQQMLKTNSIGKPTVHGKPLAKYGKKGKSEKTVIVNENGSKLTAKKSSTDSVLPFVMLKRLSSDLDANCPDHCNNDNSDGTTSDSKDCLHGVLSKMEEAAVAENESGNFLTKISAEKQKRKLASSLKNSGVKRVKKVTNGKTSFDVSDVSFQQNKWNRLEISKNPKVCETVSETVTESSFAVASPALSIDSEVTIPLDNGDSNLLNTHHNVTETDEMKNLIAMEDEDTITVNESYEYRNDDDRNVVRTSRNTSNEQLCAASDKQNYLSDFANCILQTKSVDNNCGVFDKLKNALENCLCVTNSKEESNTEKFPSSFMLPPTTSFPDEDSLLSMPVCSSIDSEDPQCNPVHVCQSDVNLRGNIQNAELSLSADNLVMPVLSPATSMELVVEGVSNLHSPVEETEICDKKGCPTSVDDISVSSSPCFSLGTESLSVISEKLPNEAETQKNVKTPFNCPFCPSILYSNFALRQHFVRAHDMGIECYFCQKRIGSRWGLRLHISRMHGSEFRNQDCIKNGNGFKCRICSKVLPSVFGRRLHMARMHSIYGGIYQNKLNVNDAELQVDDDNSEVIISKVEFLDEKAHHNAYPMTKRWLPKSLAHHRTNLRQRKGFSESKSVQKSILKIQRLNSKTNLNSKRIKSSPKETQGFIAKFGLLLAKRNFMLKSRARNKISIKNESASTGSSYSSLSIRKNFRRFKQNLCSESALNTQGMDDCISSIYDEITPENGIGLVEKYQLKDCFVSLERLCLAKVKLRPCHVSVERLNWLNVDSYWKHADDNSSISSEPEINEGISNPEINCDESCLYIKSHNKASEMKNLKQITVLDDASGELANDVFAVPSQASDDVKKFCGETHISFAQCSSCSASSGVCILMPLVCFHCKESYNACKEFALHQCPVKAKANVSHFQTAQLGADLKIQNVELEKDVFLDSAANELVKTSCMNLSTAAAQSTINSLTLSDGNQSKHSERKCLLRGKDECSDPEFLKKSTISRIPCIKLSDKVEDQSSHEVNLEICKLENFKVKSCQVKLIPLNSMELETSVTTASSCLSDFKSEKKPVHRNLFDSFGKAILQSVRDISKEGNRLLNASEIFNKKTDRFKHCLKKLCSNNLATSQMLSGTYLSRDSDQSNMQLTGTSTKSKLLNLFSGSKLGYSGSSECVENINTSVSFRDRPYSATVIQGSSLPKNIGLNAQKYSKTDEQNDICVISSDEDDVQVIDLDEINVYSSGVNFQGDLQCNSVEQSSGSQKQNGKITEANKNVHSNCDCIVADDGVITVSDGNLCEICEKSFDSTELLIRHIDLKHRRVNNSEKLISWSAQMCDRESMNSRASLSGKMSNLAELGLSFYGVSPALRNLKLGFKENGAKKHTSSLASDFSAKLAKVKRNKMRQMVESCHLASPSEIHSLGACDAMKPSSVARNILVISQT